MAKNDTIPANVKALVNAGIPLHQAVSYAALGAAAKPKGGK